MKKQESNIFIVLCLTIIVLYIVFTILYLGASIIIPFIIAVLFASAILALSGVYEKWGVPKWIAVIFSLASYIFIFYIIGNIVTANVDEIIKKLPEYQAQFDKLLKETFASFKVEEDMTVSKLFGDYDLQAILNYLLGAFTTMLRSTGIILIYTMFILFESRHFKTKLDIVSGSRYSRNHIYETIEHSKQDVKAYFIVKTIVSSTVGIASYLIMLAFGLNFAAFWALLIALLNFIPYIGSIIAVVFPSVLALVQPDLSLYSALVLITLLIVIQNIVGNVIEPKLMGNRLNLSPLVIMLSLGFWGSLWGVLGMLLCIPIMVIINIVLSKIPATRPIAIMLSEKGNLKIKPDFYGKKETDGFIKKMFGKK